MSFTIRLLIWFKSNFVGSDSYGNRYYEEKYKKTLQEYQAQQEVSRMPRSRSDEGYITDSDANYAREMMPSPRMK